jgi:hypothetical protein
MKKWLKRIGYATTGIGLLLVFFYFAFTSSWFITKAVLPRISKKLQVPVTAERVMLSPFSSVQVTGLNIGSVDARLVSDLDLQCRGNLWKMLFSKKPFIKSLEITRGDVMLKRDMYGKLNVPPEFAPRLEAILAGKPVTILAHGLTLKVTDLMPGKKTTTEFSCQLRDCLLNNLTGASSDLRIKAESSFNQTFQPSQVVASVMLDNLQAMLNGKPLRSQKVKLDTNIDITGQLYKINPLIVTVSCNGQSATRLEAKGTVDITAGDVDLEIASSVESDILNLAGAVAGDYEFGKTKMTCVAKVVCVKGKKLLIKSNGEINDFTLNSIKLGIRSADPIQLGWKIDTDLTNHTLEHVDIKLTGDKAGNRFCSFSVQGSGSVSSKRTPIELEINGEGFDLVALLRVLNPSRPVSVEETYFPSNEIAPIDLGDLNVKAIVRLNRIQYGKIVIDSTNLCVGLEDSVATVEPGGQIVLNGSPITVEGKIRLKENPIQYNVKMDTNKPLDLQPLIAQFMPSFEKKFTGVIDSLKMDLLGRGFTLQSLQKNLNATIDIHSSKLLVNDFINSKMIVSFAPETSLVEIGKNFLGKSAIDWLIKNPDLKNIRLDNVVLPLFVHDGSLAIGSGAIFSGPVIRIVPDGSISLASDLDLKVKLGYGGSVVKQFKSVPMGLSRFFSGLFSGKNIEIIPDGERIYQTMPETISITGNIVNPQIDMKIALINASERILSRKKDKVTCLVSSVVPITTENVVVLTKEGRMWGTNDEKSVPLVSGGTAFGVKISGKPYLVTAADLLTRMPPPTSRNSQKIKEQKYYTKIKIDICDLEPIRVMLDLEHGIAVLELEDGDWQQLNTKIYELSTEAVGAEDIVSLWRINHDTVSAKQLKGIRFADLETQADLGSGTPVLGTQDRLVGVVSQPDSVVTKTTVRSVSLLKDISKLPGYKKNKNGWEVPCQ